MTHDLKCWDDAFQAVMRGDKRAEFRKNDRGFCVGDFLLLREYQEFEPDKWRYTGKELTVKVLHIQEGFGIPTGFCMMSIEKRAA